ncbi:MAG: hypothetical protein A2751_02600 [Candidatus Doudnabacteria bacterium RIFCSPHIGHO2_01_FULL_46_14]|uniref:Uncharacterized protein n=1 Tax=Candidatus Doudnabacteria bacterium RIFCSPHIGHO2_01_FULL_46_14 TaxID=1817824 RepID=A0A1F5NJM4_9BACT|nr:MAG: hypothetical protein A2751_02600 [Candidatus Doudnabacteria bacterium RIFCSPHIGHO2_01_FULL_46_14]
MRGLGDLKHMNDFAAAGIERQRYEKLRNRAIARSDWERAKRYDGFVEDFRRFLHGTITVYPDKEAVRAGKFTPAEGRDFAPKG